MKLTQANIDCFEFIGQLTGRLWNELCLWQYPEGHPFRSDYDYGSSILDRMCIAASKLDEPKWHKNENLSHR